MSVNRFFDVFVADTASFGFDAFSTEVLQNTEIKLEKLKQLKDKKHGHPIFVRKMTGIVPISGVPFCS